MNGWAAAPSSVPHARAAGFAAKRISSSSELRTLIRRHLSEGKSLKAFYTDILSDRGAQALTPLLEIAEDESERDAVRWACLFGISRLAGRESAGILRKFMTHPSWMLRDAALKNAAALNAKELAPEVGHRLGDKALIVRTTAVDVTAHLGLKSLGPRLVKALFDPANYHNGKPLWIHAHILAAIRDLELDDAAPRLVDLLSSSRDESLRLDTVKTLEALTGKSFGAKPIGEQVYLWRRHLVSKKQF